MATGLHARLDPIDQQTFRLVLDDVLADGSRNLFTRVDISREALVTSTFSAELAQQVGENVLIRLAALAGLLSR